MSTTYVVSSAPPSLQSISKFEDLGIDELITTALYDHNYQHPKPIQIESYRALCKEPYVPQYFHVIFTVFSRSHFIGQAPTGSGKTAAFLIHTFMVVQRTDPKCQAIIVEPTPELATQVTNEAKIIGKNLITANPPLSIVSVRRTEDIPSLPLDEDGLRLLFHIPLQALYR